MNKKVKFGLRIVIIIALIIIFIKQVNTYHDLVKWETFYSDDAYEKSMLGGWIDRVYQQIINHIL